jgi:hypothetical protein
MKTKKGVIVISTLVITLLLIITFIIILFFMHPIKLVLTEILSNQNCKNSVRANSLMNTQGIELVEEINCPTKYKTIDGDEEQVKEKLAEEMWTCWDNFGRGRYELFEASSEKFCVVCSMVEFGSKARNHVVEIDDFSEYLLLGEPFKGQSFFERMIDESILSFKYMAFGKEERISGQELSEKIETEAFDEMKYTINTNNEYAILFTYAKESFWSRTKRIQVWGQVGATAGAVAGGALWISSAGAGGGTFLALTIAGGVIGGAIGGAVPTPEADPDQIKGQSALWTPGIILVEKELIPEIGCTYLPIDQGTE